LSLLDKTTSTDVYTTRNIPNIDIIEYLEASLTFVIASVPGSIRLIDKKKKTKVPTIIP